MAIICMYTGDVGWIAHKNKTTTRVFDTGAPVQKC